jgi:hypothetical protein
MILCFLCFFVASLSLCGWVDDAAQLRGLISRDCTNEHRSSTRRELRNLCGNTRDAITLGLQRVDKRPERRAKNLN